MKSIPIYFNIKVFKVKKEKITALVFSPNNAKYMLIKNDDQGTDCLVVNCDLAKVENIEWVALTKSSVPFGDNGSVECSCYAHGFCAEVLENLKTGERIIL